MVRMSTGRAGTRRTKRLLYRMPGQGAKAPPGRVAGPYDGDVVIHIDDARWPAHGRLWAHMVSDSDLAELHAFAAANGIPPRAFDLDHYDVPEDALPRLVAAGAHHVSGHELVRRLIASGLRITARERRGR